VKILAAKSSSADQPFSAGELTIKSGTSMAALLSQVSCLLSEAAGRILSAGELKKFAAKLAFHPQGQFLSADPFRTGFGLLTPAIIK